MTQGLACGGWVESGAGRKIETPSVPDSLILQCLFGRLAGIPSMLIHPAGVGVG